MLHILANDATKEQLESLGKESTAVREAGAHLVTIKSAYTTKGEKNGNPWNSMTVEFETKSGETVRLGEFFGNPKDNSQAEVDKANKANTRVMSIMTRLAKAVGIPDLKVATAGMIESTDAKGNTTSIYPKFAGKKLNIITTTIIEGDDKDSTKTYVKQEIDTSKFLDKDGKDAMGRDCLETLDAEAKAKLEIGYKFTQNIACIKKLQQLQEKAMGTAPIAKPITGMPTATPEQAQVAITDDSDI